jgi:hypothetical protein
VLYTTRTNVRHDTCTCQAPNWHPELTTGLNSLHLCCAFPCPCPNPTGSLVRTINDTQLQTAPTPLPYTPRVCKAAHSPHASPTKLAHNGSSSSKHASSQQLLLVTLYCQRAVHPNPATKAGSVAHIHTSLPHTLTTQDTAHSLSASTCASICTNASPHPGHRMKHVPNAPGCTLRIE